MKSIGYFVADVAGLAIIIGLLAASYFGVI